MFWVSCFVRSWGGVVQVLAEDRVAVLAVFEQFGLAGCVRQVASVVDGLAVRVLQDGAVLFEDGLLDLHRVWSRTSFELQKLRDDPVCAQQEYDRLLVEDDPGLCVDVGFDFSSPPAVLELRPKVAVLREQGTNGQVEMAAAFHLAGFEAVDVHMSDLVEGRVSLADFHGLVACGGFSFGDVLGAGQGWARSILFNSLVRDQFEAFFAREDSFALGGL